MGRSKEHKRKREDDGSQRPKKKVAIQATPPSSSSPANPPSILKVSLVQTANDCPPVIATHSGLCIPSSIDFQAYSKPQLPAPKSSKRSRKPAPPSPDLVLHSSSHPRMDYTVKEEGPGGRESHLKHYIGVFDPKTGQLSVVEAKKMAIRGVVRSQQPPEEAASERDASKTMFQLRTDLGHAFGTKKAKKALAAITENAIAPAKAVSDAVANPKKLNASSQAMMDSINEVTVNMASKEDLQAAADAAKPVPPGNFDAEEIQDVYTLESLIGGEILTSIPIKEWQEAVKKHQNVSMPNAFIASRIIPVGEGPNPTHRLRALRYLDYLIKLLKSGRPGKTRGTKTLPPKDKLKLLLDPAPEVVVENIRRKFSLGGEMRKFHIDLVYTYCCALAAVLCNFEFETSLLRHDLQLDEKQFMQYFKEIGGKVKRGTKVQIAVLALPLEFPKVRYVSNRR
ncbi:Uu.00g003370.m01.CDS01 [Anthostomella pinea]|uniref:Uu.00g003370.m01.CDS01 n=1 Tax=Anthostomella pinea TaxID=933095 RepID=A0AAI8VKG6_9PEZI|nr:Uu.00g003370.m01.CDS01 [Anthostomella pinea]